LDAANCEELISFKESTVDNLDTHDFYMNFDGFN
jgi:hypothetical protein